MKRVLLSFIVLLGLAGSVQGQKFEQLAKTPPMGWNSWNRFQCNVNEQLIRETADAMVASGMKDAGYQYVNIDDCWHGVRDSLGFIQPDAQRFPSGIKALADYVHSKGLKLGIYSDAGWKTCGGKPASRGYEFQDAQQYARWGVDYLKYDWCNADSLKASGAYITMRDALYRAGRPIVFSICEWGDNAPTSWAPAVGHLWRTTGDITNCWDCELNHGSWSQWGVLRILDKQKPLRRFAGPGHWNDPDMLEVGNGMTVTEDRAHFAMWAMLAAPLIAGNDLRTMPPEIRETLTNREIIAVNQDSLGVQGYPHKAMLDGIEVWFKPLVGGDWAMAILNRNSAPQQVTFDWSKEWVGDNLSNRNAEFGTTTYVVRDLWAKRDTGRTTQPLSVTVPGHGVEMYRLRKS
jgi:alpha-galactosidase